MVALWFVKAPLKQTAQMMSNTYSLVCSKLKTCMDIGLFLGAARTCIFRQCITFHPNNLVIGSPTSLSTFAACPSGLNVQDAAKT